jgi:hypothetical protein
MRIWYLDRPVVSTFREPELAARWMPVANESDTMTRTGPMIIEWPSSRVKLQDFIWPGLHLDLVAREEIAMEIVSRFEGARLIDLESRSRRPPRPADFWQHNPYKVLWIEKWVTADESRSSFQRRPPTPGRPNMVIEGIEKYIYADDDELAEIPHHATRLGPYIHVGRQQHMGVFVDRKLLDGCDLFRIRQMPGLLLCTDAVAEFLSMRGYPNIEPLNYGETFEEK